MTVIPLKIKEYIEKELFEQSKQIEKLFEEKIYFQVSFMGHNKDVENIFRSGIVILIKVNASNYPFISYTTFPINEYDNEKHYMNLYDDIEDQISERERVGMKDKVVIFTGSIENKLEFV